MAEEKKQDKIIRPFRYPITFVTVFFALLLIYFIIQGVLVYRKHPIQAYNIGTVVSDNMTGSFRGMVLRQEEVVFADTPGYVNYYTVSGERMTKGSLVATVDDSGTLTAKLHDIFYGKDLLSASSVRTIQEEIRSDTASYDPMDFQTAYQAKANIRSTVFECLMADTEGTLLNHLSDVAYTLCRMPYTGFFLPWADGLEGRDVSQLSAADFREGAHERVRRTNQDPVERGSFLYKIAADNQFRIVFRMTEEERQNFAGRDSLTIRMEDGREITGSFRTEELADGETAGVLTFQKYGVNYMDSRFVSFRILDKTVSGFKIPESAIIRKSFFVIDSAFVQPGGGSSQVGVLVQTDGSPVFVACTVYTKSGNEDTNLVSGADTAYIWAKDLKPGTVICADIEDASGAKKPLTYTLGIQAIVEGVYQINNGYCIFKPIVRQNHSLDTSYVMVSPGVRSGLKAFDRIVLNAEEIGENDIVFE
ncbi:MAG: hypothetical protein J6Z23_05780 [Lachnospiraceae bacterium]|nr:hypothetical protein [Lachnospiraceae bacterium]MBP5254873.1 hypothetical protein [Lachnospiraceae bacterium]